MISEPDPTSVGTKIGVPDYGPDGDSYLCRIFDFLWRKN